MIPLKLPLLILPFKNEAQLIYNTVLGAAVQQRDSVMYLFFQIVLHFILL